MYNTNSNRANFSDCNSASGSNRNRSNSMKKPKLSRQKYSRVENRPPNYNEQISEFSTLQWNQSNQRLYPTMSDSAMCGYPVPVNIPVDPRFHTMYPVFSPYMSVGIGREYVEPNQNILSRDQFTSLPPINIIDNESEIKRTHSDPGLNNQDDKFDLISSESDRESYDTIYANEIADLKKDNQRLSNELELVKFELRNLKLDLSSRNNDRCACADPGSITNIIQEIRAAHKLMEQTLESKLNTFKDNKNEIINNKSQLSSIHERLEKLENANTAHNPKIQKNLIFGGLTLKLLASVCST
ncbi:uncharacterized protein LOC112680368 isoform X3 [Sipha flava]|uniref:Uncharacterized protein LOC112680368 isoform X3 n=1 Tax=Sipha flava TaxID=143950 RepID=A0A8B8F6W1_9HEMI|nr:uncharacterized protein LOC112680368 isoform X3 [Sipha flava]